MFTRIMRAVYVVAAWLVLADILLQFYFAGYGVFTEPEHDFSFHARNANAVLILMVLTFLISLAARVGWRRSLLHLLLPVLLETQIAIFILGGAFGGSPQKSSGLPSFIVAFHVINGLTMFTIAGWLALRSLALPPRPGSRETGPPSTSRAT